MEFFNTNYFCEIARYTIVGGMDFIGVNSQLLDLEYWSEAEEEIVIDNILKSYCYALIDHVIFEQAINISNNREYVFEPTQTIKDLLKNNYNFEDFDKFVPEETDFLDEYYQFVEFLNEEYDCIYEKLLCDESEKLYNVLSKDMNFIKEVENYFK